MYANQIPNASAIKVFPHYISYNSLHKLKSNYQLYRYRETPDTTPVLNIRKQRYEDQELEKTVNRFSLSTLLEANPQNNQGSLACLKDRGHVVIFGQASGASDPIPIWAIAVN